MDERKLSSCAASPVRIGAQVAPSGETSLDRPGTPQARGRTIPKQKNLSPEGPKPAQSSLSIKPQNGYKKVKMFLTTCPGYVTLTMENYPGRGSMPS